MSDLVLQKKFNDLKTRLEQYKQNKTKSETRLEGLETQKKKLLKDIFELTKVDTIEEATKKLDEIEKALNTAVKSAEELLDE